MCLASFSGRIQQASSMMAPLATRATSMASELTSTQTMNSFPSTHQSPRTASSRVTLATVSVSMLLWIASRTSSSHPNDTEVPRRSIAATVTLSQLHTRKWLTSFLQKKVLRRVRTGGTSGASLPLLQRSLSLSPRCR